MLTPNEAQCMYFCPHKGFRLWSLRGQFSCPGKNIDKKPAQGALPKSRPLENPPAAPPEIGQNISDCSELFYQKHSNKAEVL